MTGEENLFLAEVVQIALLHLGARWQSPRPTRRGIRAGGRRRQQLSGSRCSGLRRRVQRGRLRLRGAVEVERADARLAEPGASISRRTHLSTLAPADPRIQRADTRMSPSSTAETILYPWGWIPGGWRPGSPCSALQPRSGPATILAHVASWLLRWRRLTHARSMSMNADQ